MNRIFLLLILIISINNLNAQINKKINSNKGFIDLNAYHDSRNLDVLTTNLSKEFPTGIQYFSLNNFYIFDDYDINNQLYSEQNLRWKNFSSLPIALTVQLAIQSNSSSNKWRLGFMWYLNQTQLFKNILETINLSYYPNFHLMQFSKGENLKYFVQVEHLYRLNIFPEIFNNRLYISGFADQNINFLENVGLNSTWVTETQIGLRLINTMYLVLEYKYNEYWEEKEGIGIGLQYMILFNK